MRGLIVGLFNFINGEWGIVEIFLLNKKLLR